MTVTVITGCVVLAKYFVLDFVITDVDAFVLNFVIINADTHLFMRHALVYNSLAPTTAITGYTIGLSKLSAGFFTGPQMVVSL